MVKFKCNFFVLERVMFVYSEEIDKLVDSFINKEPISHLLVSFYGNKEFKEELVNKADMLLSDKLFPQFLSTKEKALITVTISFIALSNYNGNLWEHIHDCFQLTYEKSYSEQFTDGTIRKILQEFSSYANYSNQNSAVAIPIIACGITKFWLPSYFDFCFNIYQKRLLARRDIDSNELEDEFLHVFESLKQGSHLNADADVINFGKKTYKLSRYTQESLKSGNNIRSLAKIAAKCVEITMKEIDGIDHIVPDFYYDAFVEWKNKYFRTEKDREKLKKGSRAISNFSFKFKNDGIYLITRTKWASEFLGDANDIALELFNGETLLYKTNDLDVEYDDMGAYIIHSKTLKVSENILGSFSYRITINNIVLDDSKQNLYRNVMFFNPNTSDEFFSGKTYNGVAFIITKEPINYGKKMFAENDYVCTETIIDDSKDYIIGGEHYGFKTIKKAELEGDLLEWIRYEPIILDKSFIPFKRINSIVFETATEPSKIKCILDGTIFNDIEFVNLQMTESKLYRLRFIVKKQIADGFHTLKFVDDKNRIVGEKTFEFVVDHVANQSNSIVSTSFFSGNMSLLDASDGLFRTACNLQGIGNSKALFMDLLPRISLDRKKWVGINGRIDASDINESMPILYIRSWKEPSIRCYCNNEISQPSIKKLDDDFLYSLDIGFLFSHINTYDAKEARIVISIDNNDYVFSVDILAYIDMTKSYFKYDESRKKVIFFYDFDPKKHILLSIKQRFSEIAKKYTCPCREERIIPDLESFKEYEICLIERIKTMFSSIDKVIEKFSFIYYSKDNIINNLFTIKSVEIYGDEGDEIIDVHDELTSIKIIQEINCRYKMTIQRNIASYGFYDEYRGLGILTARTNEEFEDGCLWVYVNDKDGDMLLFDHQRNIISPTYSKRFLPINRILIKPKGKVN